MHFRRHWRVVAPDWRGFGLTDRAPADCYWYPDYLADLEFILDDVVGQAPAWLVGHSMGGNVALMYAGARPQRVRAVVNLEGFGLRADAARAGARTLRAMDRPIEAGGALRDYASRGEVAARLMKNNPRLPAERAAFLAQHWSEPDGAGRFASAGDPAHRIVNPTLYRIDEVLACWQKRRVPGAVGARGADRRAAPRRRRSRCGAERNREAENSASERAECRRRRCGSHAASRSTRRSRAPDRRFRSRQSGGIDKP